VSSHQLTNQGKKVSLYEKHIELVEMVNNSYSLTEHTIAEARLRGFRDSLYVQNLHQLIDCDMYYINQGIDRPMCCGVFLDWKPESN
jgi:hypothetical protein